MDSRASASVAGYGVQSSSAIAMSERSASCTSIESSGVSRTSLPSIGERNRTPSSVILRRLSQAEHLEAAGVGEDRPLPVHEAVQPAMRAHDFGARPQHQMEGVAQHDLRAEALELLGRHRLDGAVGAHGHEGRRLDDAVRECAGARGARRRRCARSSNVGLMRRPRGVIRTWRRRS